MVRQSFVCCSQRRLRGKFGKKAQTSMFFWCFYRHEKMELVALVFFINWLKFVRPVHKIAPQRFFLSFLAIFRRTLPRKSIFLLFSAGQIGILKWSREAEGKVMLHSVVCGETAFLLVANDCKKITRDLLFRQVFTWFSGEILATNHLRLQWRFLHVQRLFLRVFWCLPAQHKAICAYV